MRPPAVALPDGIITIQPTTSFPAKRASGRAREGSARANLPRLTVDPCGDRRHHEHQQEGEPEGSPLWRPRLFSAQEPQEREVRKQRSLEQLRGEVARDRAHRPGGDVPAPRRRGRRERRRRRAGIEHVQPRSAAAAAAAPLTPPSTGGPCRSFSPEGVRCIPVVDET